jgi:hypothetical protein
MRKGSRKLGQMRDCWRSVVWAMLRTVEQVAGGCKGWGRRFERLNDKVY